MKNGVLAFALLLSAGVCGVAGFAGCSSSDETPQETADAGGDSSPADTGAPKDTGTLPDTAPSTSCQADLPSDFMCNKPADKAGSTACTDKMLTEFLNCFGTGDTAKCTAAQKAYPDCNKCVLSTWIITNPSGGGSIDVGACIQKIDPTGTCGTSVQCDTDCYNTICESCDTTAGSGSSATRSEFDDCYRDTRFAGSSSKPKGKCYDLATKAAKTCLADAKYANCIISSIDSVKNFYRGACRDNANWTNADKADGTETTDAGTDSGSDTGATDSGATDSGATDSGATDSGATDSGATDSGVLPDLGVDVLPG
ncbi:MAG: hypothetical protein ACXVEF_29205 [Polyangiales bacterium]